MAGPASIINSTGQKLPVYIGPDGEVRLPMVIGAHDVGAEPEAGRIGVASHVVGDVVNATDGVVVQAGVNGDGEATPVLTDDTGRVIVSTAASGGALTDCSGPIASGGAAETVANANPSRKYFLIQNLDIAEDLWFNFGATDADDDAPSIKLEPGAGYEMSGSFVSTEKITAFALTTGHKYTAKEG